MQRHRARGERPWDEVLPLDPRDPDVVRAKSLARQRVAGHAPRRPQGGRWAARPGSPNARPVGW